MANFLFGFKPFHSPHSPRLHQWAARTGAGMASFFQLISNKRDASKYVAKLVLCNTLVMLFALFMLEIFFGNWFNPNRINRLNLPRDISFTFDITRLYKSEKIISIYQRDKFGLRGWYSAPSAIDILTIGGSTTDQRYLTEGETWQDILAKEFWDNGKRVSVVNAGVDGQTTYGHIKNFDWWFPFIPGLKVKYFLLYIGINDFYGENRISYDDLVQPSSMKEIIKGSSALFNLYRTLIGIYRANVIAKIGHGSMSFSKIKWTSSPLLQNYEVTMQKRLLVYQNSLQIIGKKIKEFGGTPVCVTQPSRMYKRDYGSIIGTIRTTKYEGIEVK